MRLTLKLSLRESGGITFLLYVVLRTLLVRIIINNPIWETIHLSEQYDAESSTRKRKQRTLKLSASIRQCSSTFSRLTNKHERKQEQKPHACTLSPILRSRTLVCGQSRQSQSKEPFLRRTNTCNRLLVACLDNQPRLHAGTHRNKRIQLRDKLSFLADHPTENTMLAKQGVKGSHYQ